MAVLSDAERWTAVNDYTQQVHTEERVRANFNTTELKAAADATDNWIEANMASFNQALPNGYRNNATLKEKTWMFTAVAHRKAKIT